MNRIDPERLRTRLMIAAQKFATEIADAVLEANGTRDETVAQGRRPRASARNLAAQ